MSSSDFPQTPIGLPSTLNFNLPPSISDECKSYNANILPDSTASVTGPTNTTSMFIASGTGSFGNFKEENITFHIPSGNSESVFLDTGSTTLTFVMSYNVTTAATFPASSLQSMNLIGSGASWFDRLQLLQNGKVIETVNEVGLLQNYMLANTVNLSERWGGISVAMGADSNSANGIDLPFTPTGSYRYSFTIPLMSVIGVNSDKLFPVGLSSKLMLQLTTAKALPFVTYCFNNPTQQPVLSPIVLSEFQLNLRYIDVGQSAAQQLRTTMQAGKWLYKTTMYTHGSAQIPTNSDGPMQLELPIRNTSVRSILHQFGIPQAQKCPNGFYDAINPCLNRRQLRIGSTGYPSREINDLARPSEGYTYLASALGGSIPKSLGTVVFREAYNVVLPSVPTNGAVDSTIVTPIGSYRLAPSGGDTSTYGQISKFPNMAYYGYDTEKISSVLFSGVNTKQQPPVLNLNFAQPMQQVITCNAWGMVDCILEFDSATKEVIAFV
jgi:hypothetical protein